MRGIAVIAGLTCKEAVRRRVLAASVVLGLAFLVLYGFGMHLVLSRTSETVLRQPLIRRQIINTLLVMGMYAVNWLVVVLTILTAVDTIAGEINSGVIQAVATKPVRRWEIIVGKWIGFAVMLTGYIVLLTAGVLLEALMIAGQAPANFGRVLGLMLLESLLLLAVTFRAGASLSTLATGVAVFGLHILAFLGGWVEEFGWIARSQTAINIGVLASVFMPSESLWRRAAFDLQGPIIGGFARGPFSIGSVPSAWMVGYAAIYLLAALFFAVRRFSRRDL